ncbi:MAG: endonuclease/exonuclease/phosphatase family protein, partial [Pseudomonadota bacterium]
VTVRRRAKSTRTAQLGYGAFNNQTGQEIPLLNTPVANYSDLTGNDIGYRGGNAFTGQSKRLVASVGVVNGTNLYIYHANSSYKAATMVHWVAANQSDLHGPGNFIVFGDFNCEPGDVDRNLPPNTRSYHGGPTHNVHKTLDRTYDWAIGNVPLDVRAIDVTSWYSQGCCGCLGLFGVKRYNKWDLPDHLPIVISWR